MKRDERIMAWQESVKALAAAKEAEAKLRAEVIKHEFKGHKEEGVETFELGQGYKLKATFGLSYSLNNKDNAVDDALSAIEKLGGAEGELIAERLVTWKPSLSKTEYRQLPEKYKALIDGVITVKPSTPRLTLEIPKSK